MSQSFRILYVDDEADIRSIVAFALEDEADLEVELCGSSAEALKSAVEFPPDLILLDVMMPGVDGPETLRRLRALPSVAAVPVAFVTAKVQPQEIDQLLALGAIGVIAKPFDPIALPGKLRALLSDAPAAKKDRKREPSRLDELRAAYAAQLGARVDALEECWGTASAHDAWSEAHERLHHMAHSLAGSAGTFGFQRLGEVAKQLENILFSRAATDAVASHRSRVQITHLIGELHTLAAAGPDEASASLARPEVEPVRPGPAAENRNILIVEDDPLLAGEMARQLEAFGWRSRICRNASEATAVWNGGAAPAALIVDVILPEGALAGAEFLGQLPVEERVRVPHIVVSQRWDWEARFAAARAGAEAYLPKPLDFAALAEHLERVTLRQAAEPYRVLVLDDNQLLAEHYAQVLAGVGMASVAITEPARLLDTMAEHRPELVLMDLYMPGCSGIEAARVIRQDPNFVSVPIVFLSTESALAQQQRAMQTGADDFLQKPISDPDLVLAVKVRAERFRALTALIRQDGLTGLLNHVAFKLRLEAEVDRSVRSSAPLSLALVDVDRFKQVNDTHGHPTGDRVLRSLAHLLQRRLRKSDIAGRYGGEEFAIVLPGTARAAAADILDALRANFAQLRFASLRGEFTSTFSAGLAECASSSSMTELIAAADAALYRAKREGRNRVVTAAGETAAVTRR